MRYPWCSYAHPGWSLPETLDYGPDSSHAYQIRGNAYAIG